MKNFLLEKENILHIDAKIGYKWIRLIQNREFNLEAFNYIFKNNGITISNLFRYIKYYKMDIFNAVPLNPRLKIHLKDSTILKTNDPVVYTKLIDKEYNKNDII